MILEQDLSQIDQPPAHHPVRGWHRALLDQGLQRGTQIRIQPWAGTGSLAADQPMWPLSVEGEHPVAHGLKPNPAESGRLGAQTARVDRRQSQKAAGLIRIARALGQSSQGRGIKIWPQRHRSGHHILLRLQT